MTPLTQQDILSHTDYETQRSTFRGKIIKLKQRRRIQIGPLVTLIFENRETLLFQIQEMIRVERIYDPTKVQDEIDVYNSILPGKDELSATLMIEITDEESIQKILDSLKGIDCQNTLSIKIDKEITFAKFEAGHSKEDKVSAVHFVRFQPSLSVIKKLKDHEMNATIQVAHKNYVAEENVPNAMRQEWISDLDN